MASPTQWTWVWVDSGSWWWTGRPGMLRFMGLQRVRHDWATKLNWVKAIVFPLVVYGCETWTIRKAECQRIDAFELWCWRRLLRVPWIARKSNQSILKEISPEYSLEGLMLKLKLPSFGHLMQRTDSLEKILVLAKIEGWREWDNRGWDGRVVSPTQWTWVWVSSGSLWWPEAWHASALGVTESDTTERLNWTDASSVVYRLIFVMGANLVKRYLDDFPGYLEVGLEGTWNSIWT